MAFPQRTWTVACGAVLALFCTHERHKGGLMTGTIVSTGKQGVFVRVKDPDATNAYKILTLPVGTVEGKKGEQVELDGDRIVFDGQGFVYA